MPIKPENAKRYPADWKHIVEQVRNRSGNCCEGSPAFPQCRAVNHLPHPITGSVVVLTVAHLDHQPENCSLENLKHWCQRCHNVYDSVHRRRNAHATRHSRKAIADLFMCSALSSKPSGQQ